MSPSEALVNFIATLDPDTAESITRLPPQEQEAAAAQLAQQMMDDGRIGPWQSPEELRGRHNPADTIDWRQSAAPSSTSHGDRGGFRRTLRPTTVSARPSGIDDH